MLWSIFAETSIHLSIVVPVYNEEDHLDDMAGKLAPDLDRIAGSGRWQFLFIDNGSTDASPAICVSNREPLSGVEYC